MAREDKQLEERALLGMNLHTALRKCCDSTPTSIAYNLISLDEFDGAWGQYLGLVMGQEKPVTVPKLMIAAQRLEWGEAHRNALRATFELFSDDDWAGFIAFEEEEESER